MYDLSVSIVAYNDYDDITNNISSLEKYISKKINKIIYVIDNSDNKDDKDNFIGFLNNYKDIEYIETNKNLGFGRANNIVLDRLDSKYHALINPDVIFIEDSFKKIIDYLNLNQDIGMVIPKLVDNNGNQQNVYREEVTVFDMFIRMFAKNSFKKRQAYHTMQDKDFSKPFEVPFGQGSFLVIRTELFKKIKGFDERYFLYMEDADLSKKVNEASKLMYFPYTSVIHKWSKGSHKSFKLFKYHVLSMFKYFNKWGWKFK